MWQQLRAQSQGPRRFSPPAAGGRSRACAEASAGTPPSRLAPRPDWLRAGSAPSQGAGQRRLQSGEGHGAGRRAPPPASLLRPRPLRCVLLPPLTARAGSHGGSERAAGPLPNGRPGWRPGSHGVRRGGRAALPDRAEVSARPARPQPAGSPGRPRGRTPPPCPARLPRRNGARLGAHPRRKTALGIFSRERIRGPRECGAGGAASAWPTNFVPEPTRAGQPQGRGPPSTRAGTERTRAALFPPAACSRVRALWGCVN